MGLEDRMNGNLTNMLTNCEQVTTMEGATQPVLTPLLPIRGLRRDASGNLTTDALQTAMEAVRSLGVDPSTPQAYDAILFEAKQTLCRIHSQYTYLINTIITSISRGEPVPLSTVDAAREKNQMLQDILSISRHVLEQSAKSSQTPVEGFRVRPAAKLEGFQTLSTALQQDMVSLQSNSLVDLKRRSLEDTEEKNTYANRMLAVYGVLNIVAIGLLIYISSGN